MKSEKINFRKSLGIYYIGFKNVLAGMEGSSEIFSRPQVIENSRQYQLLRKDILQKGCSNFQGTFEWRNS